MKQDRCKQIIALLLAASIVSLSATGCAQQRPADSASAQQEQQQPEQQPESAAQTPDSTEAAAQPEEAPPSEQAEQPEQDKEPVPGLSDQETADSGQTGELTYIQQLAQDIADELVTPEMSEYEKVKTLFDYMLDTTAIGEPIGIEIWRVRGNYTEPPSYLEQRALSVLLYHVGMCEDYAAALTLLYRAAGLQAEYVPGITYSAEGPLVDHYWTMVMVDGQWYHVDPQLEDNISRHGYVRYRYFMRGRSIHASHWWGQNLIDSGMLTPEQEEDVRQHYLFPEGAEEDYPTPERRPIIQTGSITKGTGNLLQITDAQITASYSKDAAIQAEIDAEFAAYEAEHGPLEPVELNWDLLIFGPAGYGPPD